MKFSIFFLVFGFVVVNSADETTDADIVATTIPAVPENDVSNDEIPVDHINFLRQSDTADSESSTAHFTELACTRDNMEWLSCGPRCYQTCGFQPRDAKQQRKSRAVCASSNDTGCYAGCYCKSGYVRLNDNCVLPTMCPLRPCLVNEEYKICGSPCQLNCDNYAQKALIDQQCPNDLCIRGCFCRPGYVRALSGLCVLPVRCPRPFVS